MIGSAWRCTNFQGAIEEFVRAGYAVMEFSGGFVSADLRSIISPPRRCTLRVILIFATGSSLALPSRYLAAALESILTTLRDGWRTDIPAKSHFYGHSGQIK